MDSLIYQSTKQRLFGLTPKLLALTNEEILMPFREWAEMHRLSFNWALHVHLLNWLNEYSAFKKNISEEICKELLTAACIRWALNGLEHINIKGIVIASPHLPNYLIGFNKSSQADLPGKIIEATIKLNVAESSFALRHSITDWQSLNWLVIPN